MLVSFNPAMQRSSFSNKKSQNPTFGENPLVDQKWLKKIIADPDLAWDEYRIHFLNPNNKISKEEYIATLTESLKSIGDGFKDCMNKTIEWAQKFNRAS